MIIGLDISVSTSSNAVLGNAFSVIILIEFLPMAYRSFLMKIEKSNVEIYKSDNFMR